MNVPNSQALVPSLPSTSPVQEAVNLLDVARAQKLLRPLSPDQRKFLRFRGLYESDMQACVALGYGRDFCKNALRRSPAFKAAYEAILIDPVVHGMAELALLVPKAVQRLDELMDDRDGKVAVKAVENVLKSKGVQILGEMTLKVQDERSPEENPYLMALMRLQEARIKMRERGLNRGAVIDVEEPVDVLEGEVWDVTDENTAQHREPPGTEKTPV